MDTGQLRKSFLDALKNRPSGTLDLVYLGTVARCASALGFIDQQEEGRERLQPQDEIKFRELFWAFVNEGLIIPGNSIGQPDLPFFQITEHGRKVLESDDPSPHDPDGYLHHLKQVAPRVDEVAMFYVEEGLKCYQKTTYTAAVVMLGVSAERITFTLANAVATALSGTEADRLRKSISNDKIAKIYGEMKKRLESRVNKLPSDLRDGLTMHLDGVFAAIRTNRNDAGHPTGKVIDQQTALGLFSSFPFYCRMTSDLIVHMESKGLP